MLAKVFIMQLYADHCELHRPSSSVMQHQGHWAALS